MSIGVGLKSLGAAGLATALMVLGVSLGLMDRSHAQAGGTGVAAVACKIDGASVVRAYRASRGAETPQPGMNGPTDVQLGDEVWVEVDGLAGLAACETADHPLILFLGGRGLKKLTRDPMSDPRTGIAKFTLTVTSDSRDAWTQLTGRPDFNPRILTASVGIQDRFPVPSSARLSLNVFPLWWFIGWVVIFLALVAAFVWCAACSNIIRDGQPDPAAKTWHGPYSLSRTQAAWWFFIVLASYLLIGLVTGNWVGSLNGTALALLGIGAGTVVASTAIDASKAGPAAQVAQQQAEQTAKSQVTQFSATTANLNVRADAETNAQAKADLLQQKADAETRLEAAKSNLAKLHNESESFFKDLVSDADGVSFHRFQLVGWTLVLAVVFVHDVYTHLAMPDFDATLLGLIGISAGTYLGLKTTESTVPKKVT